MSLQKNLSKALFLIFIFAFQFVSANSGDFNKKIHQEYDTNVNSILDVENKYGTVNITTWDQNKIVIDVIIIAEVSKQEKADNIFKKISIDFSKNAQTIKAFTNIQKGLSSHFSINYEIKMPRAIALKLENKYGNVKAGSFTGKCDFIVKFGDLNIEEIFDNDDKPRSSITLEYSSNSKLNKCNILRLDLSFSTIEVEQSNTLMVISKYSTLKSKTIKTLITDSKFDTYIIGQISNLNCVGQYSTFKINKFESKLDAEIKFTELKIASVANNFSKIKIKSQYGESNLKLETFEKINLNLKAEFGDIQIKSSLTNLADLIKEKNTTKTLFVKSIQSTENQIVFDGHFASLNLN